MEVVININNAPNRLKKYTVCRISECELWYWGTYESKDRARKAAMKIDGVIVEGREQ